MFIKKKIYIYTNGDWGKSTHSTFGRKKKGKQDKNNPGTEELVFHAGFSAEVSNPRDSTIFQGTFGTAQRWFRKPFHKSFKPVSFLFSGSHYTALIGLEFTM